jgi:hypothetical protein
MYFQVINVGKLPEVLLLQFGKRNNTYWGRKCVVYQYGEAEIN